MGKNERTQKEGYNRRQKIHEEAHSLKIKKLKASEPIKEAVIEPYSENKQEVMQKLVDTINQIDDEAYSALTETIVKKKSQSATSAKEPKNSLEEKESD